MTTQPSREAATQGAAEVLVIARASAAAQTPREQAEAAWDPSCGMTLDELEDWCRRRRGLPLAHAS